MSRGSAASSDRNRSHGSTPPEWPYLCTTDAGVWTWRSHIRHSDPRSKATVGLLGRAKIRAGKAAMSPMLYSSVVGGARRLADKPSEYCLLLVQFRLQQAGH